MNTTAHKPRPEGPNWVTIKHNGAWRDACAECGRWVRLYFRNDLPYWRHVR